MVAGTQLRLSGCGDFRSRCGRGVPSPLARFVARGLYPSLGNFYFALESEHLLHVPKVETVKFSL